MFQINKFKESSDVKNFGSFLKIADLQKNARKLTSSDL